MGCRTSKYLYPDISFSFYFSIQMKPYPRRQAGQQFERRPYFLANSLSLRQRTDSLGSSTHSHNDCSYKDLRIFFSACSSWPTVWILTMVITRPTLTNPFWPAATLSMFTLHLPAPPSTLLLTTSATPYFLRTSDH